MASRPSPGIKGYAQNGDRNMLGNHTVTPAVADAGRELTRCVLEAERTYPVPGNRDIDHRQQVLANRAKATNVVMCMRAADYTITHACAPSAHQTFMDCGKRTDKLAERMPYRYEHFNQEEYCRHKGRSVWAETRLSANCYQSNIWWRRLLSQ